MCQASADPLPNCVQAVLAAVSSPVCAPEEMPDIILVLGSLAGITRGSSSVPTCGSVDALSMSQGRKYRNFIQRERPELPLNFLLD